MRKPMSNRTKVLMILGTLAALSGWVRAVGNFKAAIVWYSTASSWLAATGSSSGRGVRWDTSSDAPIAHQNSGTELAMTLPAQTGQSGKFLTTNGTTASWSTTSASAPQVFVSLGSFVQAHSPTADGTDATFGAQFYFTRAATVSGVEFYWPSGPTSITVELWAGGVAVATGTATYTGPGVSTINFTTPYSAAAYTHYVASLYANGSGQVFSNAANTEFPNTNAGVNVPTTTFVNGPSFVLLACMYSLGHAAPATATSVVYPATPVFTVP